MQAFSYRWFLIVLDVLLLGGLLGYVIVGRDAVPFHGDESSLIYISRDYHTLVYDHDLSAISYDGGRVYYGDQFLRTTTGALTPFLIGAAWDIDGFTVRDLNYGWDWSIGLRGTGNYAWHANVLRRTVPEDDLLYITRTPSTLLAALSVLLVYAIARWMAEHRVAGWFAAVLYATNPAVLVNGRRAMQEGATLFFTTLLILVTLRVVQVQTRASARWRDMLRWYIVFGVAAGFTVGVKQSAALIVAPAFLAIAAAPLFRAPGNTHLAFSPRHAYNLAGIVTLAWLVMLLLNPVWWFITPLLLLLGLTILLFAGGGPLQRRALMIARVVGGTLVIAMTIIDPGVWFYLPGGVFRTLGERADLIESQKGDYGGMDSPGARIEMLGDELLFEDAQYFEDPRWAEFDVITQQIADYEAAGLEGWYGPLRGVVALGCLLLGLLALALRWRFLEAWILAAWLVLPAWGLLITNPLPWQRYYIILQAPLAVIGGFGMIESVRHIRALVARRATPPQLAANA